MTAKRLSTSVIVTCLVTCFVAFLLPSRLAADIIASHTAEILTNSPGFFGESVITPTGPGWNNITFNWISPTSSPVAFGTLFLLSQQYLGTPAALSSSTAGFLAASTGISSGKYVFPSAVVLLPGTTYWFYSNGLISAGAITLGCPSGSCPSLAIYFSASANTNFAGDNVGQENFSLQGTAVPEPSSLVLLASGLAGLLGAARKRGRNRSSA